MSTLIVSSHLEEQMNKRANLDRNSLNQMAKIITPLVERFNPEYIHQIAVIISELPRPVQVGNSVGDRLIWTVDIRTRVITTGFVRFANQGKPVSCQRMINLDGEIVL